MPKIFSVHQMGLIKQGWISKKEHTVRKKIKFSRSNEHSNINVRLHFSFITEIRNANKLINAMDYVWLFLFVIISIKITYVLRGIMLCLSLRCYWKISVRDFHMQHLENVFKRGGVLILILQDPGLMRLFHEASLTWVYVSLSFLERYSHLYHFVSYLLLHILYTTY